MDGFGYAYSAANSSPSHDVIYENVARFLEGVPPGSTVLDMGCGNGTFLSRFRGRGWRLQGTDLSPTGIEIARSTFPDIEFFLADASGPTGYAAERVGQIDAIISTEVIEHLYDPRTFLRNVYDILKPGGIFILSTPYHGYLKSLLMAVTGKMESHFTVLWDHGHIKFWSRKTLTFVLDEAGFIEIRFAGSGRFPYLWKSMVMCGRKPLLDTK